MTKNSGKYYSMKELLSKTPYIDKVLWLNNVETISEGNNIHENARNKAIKGSLNISEPVIASDEAIYLDFLNEEEQPGACIKRVVSENASDIELINFYSNLIKQKKQKESSGRIISAYAIALEGRIVNEFEYIQECTFKYPPSQTIISGRPLASLHYFKEYNKYYSELSEDQKNILNNKINDKVISFINETLNFICEINS